MSKIQMSNDSSVVNSAIVAMQKFQEQMSGKADKSGFSSENDVDEWITQSRCQENAK